MGHEAYMNRDVVEMAGRKRRREKKTKEADKKSGLTTKARTSVEPLSETRRATP
jgi:hypothetical protein